MMIASNNGVGNDIGFPDVCNSPPPPPTGPVPTPYPNVGMNTTSAVFSPNVFTGFMPSLNMASAKPMTNGDNSGVLHPLFMQAGGQTAGNPIVFVNCVPAKNLLVPTFGNAFNNPSGAAVVPSVSVTLYTDREVAPVQQQPVGVEQARALRDAVQGAAVSARDVGPLRLLRIERFVSDVATQVFNALRRFDGAGLIIDLRGNPGGDARACCELLDDFVAAGQLLALQVEGDDPTERRARGPQAYPWPLVVLVDAHTASAAELFAGSLQALGRAELVGRRTLGKGSAQRLCANRDGEGLVYASVAEYRLPDGRPIHGRGVAPDHPAADDAVEKACELLGRPPAG